MAKRLLSGITPTGDVHVGNYFGAIKQFVDLQDTYDCFVFIADLHALNQVHDSERMRRNISEVALTYLSVGLDPEKACLFRQSDVSAHAELCVMLNSITSLGLLERAHAFKDAIANGKNVNAGLFDYPVLMAADILLYKPQVVPVGKDQQQHVEIMADIGGRFNHLFGETFAIPEGLIMGDVATVPGLDGRKMSKSYGNVIGLFDEPEVIRKKVMGIVTDSKRPEEPKDPATCNVFALHKLVATPEELVELERRYREGGIGYKESKERLGDELVRFLAPFQARRTELEGQPEYVRDVLARGAERARSIANETLAQAKRNAGF